MKKKNIYRIVTTELVNGTKRFTPQVKKVIYLGSLELPWLTEWKYIYDGSLGIYHEHVWVSSDYNSEEEALKHIQGYKVYLEKMKGYEIKSTSTKTIESHE